MERGACRRSIKRSVSSMRMLSIVHGWVVMPCIMIHRIPPRKLTLCSILSLLVYILKYALVINGVKDIIAHYDDIPLMAIS